MATCSIRDELAGGLNACGVAVDSLNTMRAIRTLIAGVMAVGGAALLAAGLVPGDGPEPARASTNHVVNIVTGGTFSPSTITIAPGDTVTFVNTSSTVANAISQLGGTDPNFFQTDTFVYAGAQSCARKSTSPTCWTFPNTGTFTYQNNMQDPKPTGTIIVSGSGGATATPTETSGGGGGGGGGPTNHIVNIVTGGTFSPSTITITTGDTVTFSNTSSTVANAMSQLGGTDPNFFQTDTFVYAGTQSCARKSTSTTCWTFPNAGTFTYQNNMQDPKPTGTIIVVSGGGGGGDPTSPPPATNTPTKTPTPIPTATSPGSGGGSPTSTPTKTPTPLPTATTPSGGGGGGGSPTNTPTLLPTATTVPTQEAGNQTGFGNLGPGWNLVVYYGPTMATSQAVQGIPSNYSVIYHWHGTGYSRYVKPGMAPPWVSTLHVVQDGQVYWVYIQ